MAILQSQSTSWRKIKSAERQYRREAQIRFERRRGARDLISDIITLVIVVVVLFSLEVCG